MFSLMSSHHNKTFNFSHSPYKSKKFSSDVDQEIILGEFRLRYVKLMRDIHIYLTNEEAKDLLNESVAIWEKLNCQKF